MFQDGKVNNDILTICNSLAEIINIWYDNYTRRTPKQILRLYNLCYLFSSTCISVIGNPNTMSERKIYGNNFQSNHTCSWDLPTCLPTLRSSRRRRRKEFWRFKTNLKNTSNRQHSHVIDNAVLRFRAQQKYREKQNSFQRQ